MSGGDFNGVPVVRLRSSDNSIAIDGSGDIDIRTGAAATTLFRFIPLGANTGAPVVPTDILVVPGGITMAQAGRIMLDFDATIQVTPPAGAGGLLPCGVVVTYFVDGVARPEFAFFQLDVGAAGVAFDTFDCVVRLRAIFQLTAGNHTCSVQWDNASPATPSTLDTFAGGGMLTIQGV